VNHAQLAARIKVDPGPVLFLDTCALFDLFRVGYSTRVPVAATLSAAAAIDLARRGRLWIVATSTVVNEFNNQADSQDLDLRKHIQESIDRQARLVGVLLLASDPTSDIAAVDRRIRAEYSALTASASSSNLATMLRSRAESLLGMATILREDVNCIKRASARQSRGLKPGKRGATVSNDCIIIETYLAFNERLANLGISTPSVFVSSNKSDFMSGSKWHPDLAPAARASKLRIVTDMARGLRALRL
jgi:hypothetical protein